MKNYWSVQFKNSLTNCWQDLAGSEQIASGPEACAIAEELVRAIRKPYCVIHYGLLTNPEKFPLNNPVYVAIEKDTIKIDPKDLS